MTPRRADPFEPGPGLSFSKGEVNRAGRLIYRFWSSPVTGEDMFDGWDVDELIEAFTAVTWWRGLHARPLSKVAANLRYHVDQEGGRIDRRVDVTQRLKRRATMINKLEREPTMEITQMHDIGGVRARLPSLPMSGRSVGVCARRGRSSGRVGQPG